MHLYPSKNSETSKGAIQFKYMKFIVVQYEWEAIIPLKISFQEIDQYQIDE